MFNIGSQELLVVLLLVFLLFGPRHIPEVAHALGKGLGDLRRAIQGIEDNVKRAGGDLPRFPRDLDDLEDRLSKLPAAPAGTPGEPGPGQGPSSASTADRSEKGDDLPAKERGSESP